MLERGDFNGGVRLGRDLGARHANGASSRSQFWRRDPAASFGLGLSEAIEFLIQN